MMLQKGVACVLMQQYGEGNGLCFQTVEPYEEWGGGCCGGGGCFAVGAGFSEIVTTATLEKVQRRS